MQTTALAQAFLMMCVILVLEAAHSTERGIGWPVDSVLALVHINHQPSFVAAFQSTLPIHSAIRLWKKEKVIINGKMYNSVKLL